MFRSFIVILMIYGTVLGQIPDSTTFSKPYKSPAKAATWAFLAPGGGQFYNGQKLKGTALLGGAIVSGILYIDYSSSLEQLYTGPRLPYILLVNSINKSNARVCSVPLAVS